MCFSTAVQQLDDRQVYEEVEVDPTVEVSKTIHDRLTELREEDPGLEEVTGYLEVKAGHSSKSQNTIISIKSALNMTNYMYFWLLIPDLLVKV